MFGNERGYSLIELMLALTIIGLLAAVAAPKVSHVLAVSRTQKVAADLQMLDAAVMMYEAEKGVPPAAGEITVLDAYVENIGSVKPPKDSTVIVDGAEQKVNVDKYQLQQVTTNVNPRATCDGKTAESFLPARTGSTGSSSGASSGQGQ